MSAAIATETHHCQGKVRGNGKGSGTGASKLTEDVVQVLSQLNPIMQQLAGVNLSNFLQDISKLPGAVAGNLDAADTERKPPKRTTDDGPFKP